MTMDTEHFRKELLEHRERLLGTIEHHDIGTSSLIEETGELMSSSANNHLADTASETYERELDEGLENDAQDQLRQVDEALARIEAGEYGTCSRNNLIAPSTWNVDFSTMKDFRLAENHTLQFRMEMPPRAIVRSGNHFTVERLPVAPGHFLKDGLHG